MSFGEMLAKKRQEHGYSQFQLSQKSGVSQAQISNIESSVKSPTESTMLMLSRALGCTLADFLCEQTTPETETSPVDGLTSEESSLISMFRELNEEGKRKLIDYADDLSQSGKYIKNSSSRLGKARAQ